jgi:hypothetical protein
MDQVSAAAHAWLINDADAMRWESDAGLWSEVHL